MHEDVSSCMLYNGHVSSYFEVNKGARQGDPISPFLFNLCVSVLAAALQYHPNIKGLSINDTEYLLTQFADDITLILDGTENTMRNVFDILAKYESCSGLKVNIDKTKAVWIGKHCGSNREICNEIKVNWIKDSKFKSLGIEYDLTTEDITENNYTNRLEKIKKLLSTWSWRNLTIFGKLTVIKNLAIPMLVHLFRALPTPSEEFFKELENICYKFIWNNKPDKIRRSVLISNHVDGGIKMLHLKSFCKSMKSFWITKMINDEIVTNWKTLILDTFSKFGGNLVWQYHPISLDKISKLLNPFWKNILELWSEIYEEPNNCYSQTLWFNQNILIGNKTVFYADWAEIGINHVNDLLNNQGKIYSHREFNDQFGLGTHSLRYEGIISAFPREWKQTIRTKQAKLNQIEVRMINKIKGKQNFNKYVYNRLAERHREKVNIKEKWEQKLEITNLNLDNYFLILHKHLRDSYLKAFQYKILHRILPTNKLLFKMKLSNTSVCYFCNTYTETLEHFFWDCILTKNIWLGINENLRLVETIENFKLNKETVLFGFDNNTKFISGINIFITLIKSYIFKCKSNSLELSFEGAKFFLIYHCKIHINLTARDADREWAFLGDWLE